MKLTKELQVRQLVIDTVRYSIDKTQKKVVCDLWFGKLKKTVKVKFSLHKTIEELLTGSAQNDVFSYLSNVLKITIWRTAYVDYKSVMMEDHMCVGDNLTVYQTMEIIIELMKRKEK